jgi:ribosome-associated protein
MIRISHGLYLPEREIELRFVRAQGPGGQHVNKASTAVQLRFDVAASSLPSAVKHRLLGLDDQRLTRDGVVVIKAQQWRSQEQNRQEAVDRLVAMIRDSLRTRPARRPTRVPKAVKRRRLNAKVRRGQVKRLRTRPRPEESS